MTRLFGHERQQALFDAALANGQLHHAWLLAGPEGVGKGGFARNLALRMLSGQIDAPAPDSQTVRLVEAGSHPDFALLGRSERDNGELARNIGIDQVRNLHRLLESAPSLAPMRVILIDSADDMELPAANALLKSLEEPPARTIFLLVSHAPSRLLPTIRSRCRTMRFFPLSDDDMRLALRQAAPQLGEAEIAHLISVSEGSPGKALSLTGSGTDEFAQQMDAILSGGDADNVLRTALAQSLSARASKSRFEGFLNFAPGYFAALARRGDRARAHRAIAAWEDARQIGASALVTNLDPGAVVYHIASLAANMGKDR